VVNRPTTEYILSLLASIVSVNGPPWLHFLPVKLLNFDFITYLDPDPAHKIVYINANQNPQPCKKIKSKKEDAKTGSSVSLIFHEAKLSVPETNIP
jgi:hypothetical protein